MNYMDVAYNQALKALKIDEVPIGSVIVKDNKIIAKAYNKKERKHNPLGHAELICIKKATRKLKNWRLNDCDIYVTLEPCSMCMSALIQARIRNIYYGCIDFKSGAIEGSFSLLDSNKFNHIPKCECLNDSRCSLILKEYFKSKRNK